MNRRPTNSAKTDIHFLYPRLAYQNGTIEIPRLIAPTAGLSTGQKKKKKKEPEIKKGNSWDRYRTACRKSLSLSPHQ